jgi:Fic family protein
LKYISVQQAANNWGISDRRVRILCDQGKVVGSIKEGRSYKIPSEAVKPIDGRKNRHKKIPDEFQDIFEHIDSLKAALEEKHKITIIGDARLLTENFLCEYIFNSNALEGNELTLEETSLVLKGRTINDKTLRHHIDSLGLKDAFLYLQKLAYNNVPLSELVINNIYSSLLLNDSHYTEMNKRSAIHINKKENSLTYSLMTSRQLKSIVRESNKKNLHPIESASLLLLKFYDLHPFSNGNGTIARLLLNFILMRNGYPPVCIRSTDVKRYYEGLYSYCCNGSSSELINLISGYLEYDLKNCLFNLNYP